MHRRTVDLVDLSQAGICPGLSGSAQVAIQATIQATHSNHPFKLPFKLPLKPGPQPSPGRDCST